MNFRAFPCAVALLLAGLAGVGAIPNAWARSLPILGFVYDANKFVISDKESESPQADWTFIGSRDRVRLSVGVLYGAAPSCTATLIETNGKDSAPAYALSAGHCYTHGKSGGPFLSPGEVVAHEPVTDPVTFFFGNSKEAGGAVYGADVAGVAYASMLGRDIQILELKESYRDLVAKGLRPLKIGSIPDKGPEGSTPVIAIGAPSRGGAFLKASTCDVFGHWRETSFQPISSWVGLSNERYFMESFGINCSALPGSSGGPIITAADLTVRGVMSSVPVLPDEAAFLARYSVIRTAFTDLGMRDDLYLNSVASIDGIADCFDAKGVFDLSLPACKLTKPCAEGQDEDTCMETRCKDGNREACAHQVLSWESTRPEEEGPLTPNPFAKKACEAGNAYACMIPGFEEVSAGKAPEAVGSFARACEKGVATSCYNAVVVRSSLGLTGSAGDDGFEKACFGHEQETCEWLAQAHFRGRGRPKSEAKAYSYAARAAAIGPSLATYLLAFGYYEGNGGLSQSLEKAKSLFDLSCREGDQRACKILTKLNESDDREEDAAPGRD